MTESSQPRKMNRAKLVVLGRDNCGKTALCVRFITRRFIGEYDHKKEVTYRCRKTVDSEPIDLEMLDTANKQECVGSTGSSLESSIRWGDGFLIIYSITDRSSFEAVSRLKRLIDHIKQALGIPTVIVANKTDVENGRVVRTEEGQTLAADLRCSFYELSVAEGCVAVETAVAQLVREVRLEYQRHLLVMDTRSRMLQMTHALRSRLTRSKTMQW
ncbi:ras-related and estrogen-regulated growth inhibitor [Hypomesus transpacificus]|uniref:ras-related and estrogen-regulated growth inhibitor n=1 Tax=Hypomesus transpacificus TaxID=137520 RepID=UPI001F080673|nr:ras-related and estrogen-regulated growth inhibitor [Hypomesus transpacificus]